MFSVVENTPSCFASVSLHRDTSAPEFQESDLDLLRFLVPHLQRAFSLHVQISRLFCAARPSESAQLQRAVAEAVLTSTGKGLGPAGPLVVTRRGGASALSSGRASTRFFRWRRRLSPCRCFRQ